MKTNKSTAQALLIFRLSSEVQKAFRMCVGGFSGKQTHERKLREYAHTHTHTTVAGRIMQQITDPVNYMWPLPEVRGHRWQIRRLRQADRGQNETLAASFNFTTAASELTTEAYYRQCYEQKKIL